MTKKNLPSSLRMGEKNRDIGRDTQEYNEEIRMRNSGDVSRTGERPSARLTLKEEEELNKKIERLLEQYTGSGGLQKAGAQTRGILDEYYTPLQVVNFTWKRIKKMLDTDIIIPLEYPILEPAVGTGRFLKKHATTLFNTLRKGF